MTVAAFVAGDRDLPVVLPFLERLRASHPAFDLLWIPKHAATPGVARFAALYRIEVLTRDFAAIDRLDRICCGIGAEAGSLRILAALDIVGTPVVILDPAERCISALLDPLLARVADATHPTMAAWPESPGMLALGGRSVGSEAVIQAVRGCLVASMLAARSGPGLATRVLTFALRHLGIVPMNPDAPCPIVAPPKPRIVPLESVAKQVFRLDNGGAYRRAPARIVGAPASLVEAHNRKAREEPVQPPPAMVAQLHNVTVHARGVVTTADGDIIRESLINAPPDVLASAGPAVHHDVTGPVVLLMQTWDDNYGHWLIESLPRVGLAAECLDLATCRFLIGAETGAIGQVYRDSLGLLGIAPEQLIRCADEVRFCADLIYPAPLTVQPWIKAPRAIRFLEALAERLPRPAAGPGRLYVSRNRAGRRILRNEAEVLPGLRARGYDLVEPESLDFMGQIGVFREATHIVGNVGAALANLAFAPRGVRVLALTTEFMQDDFYYDIVSHKQGCYMSLHGTAADPDAGWLSDFAVEPAMLWTMLDELERA